MGLSEVLNLDYSTYSEFCQYIPILENQERLIAYDVSAYPHIKDNKRNEIFKQVKNIAWPDDLQEHEVIRTDQILIKLNKR